VLKQTPQILPLDGGVILVGFGKAHFNRLCGVLAHERIIEVLGNGRNCGGCGGRFHIHGKVEDAGLISI